ncbi:MAG: DUF2190 family protein, partial [Alphaproteobacteria bacterium]|nr:DUF2190 family protein [Alphaproteobacteria bacterium]
MSTNNAILTRTVRAGGAIVARRAVGFDGAQASVAGQKVLGVADYAAADGVPLAVTVKGT